MSAATYWLSASTVTITSAPERSAASIPAPKASASPRRRENRTTRVAPCSNAIVAVPSLEPSSTTIVSISSSPGTSAGRSASTRGNVSASSSAGMTTTSFIPAGTIDQSRTSAAPRSQKSAAMAPMMRPISAPITTVLRRLRAVTLCEAARV